MSCSGTWNVRSKRTHAKHLDHERHGDSC